MISVRFHCSTEAFSAKYVGILILLAFLGILPAIYHNRATIKLNLRKFANCIRNCCCKNKNEIPYSDVSTEISTCNDGDGASEEDQHSCQAENDN